MRGNKILYAGIAVLVLGIGFAVGTYAYYQNTITGHATGTVLAWNCTADGEAESFSVGLGALYPGAHGSYSFDIVSAIAANYTVTFSDLTNMGTGAANHPNLKLYSDSGYTTEITEGLEAYSGTTGAGTAGKATITFYYNWPSGYGTGTETDVIDTYSTAAPSVDITVLCTQRYTTD